MRDIKEMAREVKMPYDFTTGEPLYLAKLEAFAELVRADEREQAQKWFEPAPLRDAMVANLVREGIGKHKARELADHFINLTNAQPTVPDALTPADKESPEYTDGWNDCRAETLKMRKPK